MFRGYTATPLDERPLVTARQSAAWPFDIAATAVEGFEAMPSEFTFDDLVDQSQALRRCAG